MERWARRVLLADLVRGAPSFAHSSMEWSANTFYGVASLGVELSFSYGAAALAELTFPAGTMTPNDGLQPSGDGSDQGFSGAIAQVACLVA